MLDQFFIISVLPLEENTGTQLLVAGNNQSWRIYAKLEITGIGLELCIPKSLSWQVQERSRSCGTRRGMCHFLWFP